MSSNTDLALVGEELEGYIRKITDDQTADADQHVVGDRVVALLSGVGFIGAKDSAGAVMELTNCTILISADSTRYTNGAIVYGPRTGRGTRGKTIVRNSHIVLSGLGSTDQFFSELVDSVFLSTSIGTQLLRFQAQGTFSGCRVDFGGTGSIELHGDVTILNNSFTNLSFGFANTSTGLTLLVEGQDFNGRLTRLGSVNDTSQLRFANCSEGGVDYTQADLQNKRYTMGNTGSARIFFAKRRITTYLDRNNEPTTATTIYRHSGADTTYEGAEANHLQDFFRTDEVIRGLGSKVRVWHYFVTEDTPIERFVIKEGYLLQHEVVTAYDDWPLGDEVVTLVPDEAYDPAFPGADITGIVISGDTITISESVTLQQLYNFIRHFLSLPANLHIGDFLSVPNGIVVLDGYNVTVVSGGALAPDGRFTGIQTSLQVLAEGTGEITCTIQDANGDSLLRFQAPVGIHTFSIHATLADADDNLNPLASGGANMRYVAADVAGDRFLRAVGDDRELLLPILIQAAPGIYDEAVLVTETTTQLTGLESALLDRLDDIQSNLGTKIDNIEVDGGGGGGGGGSSTASTNILVG